MSWARSSHSVIGNSIFEEKEMGTAGLRKKMVRILTAGGLLLFVGTGIGVMESCGPSYRVSHIKIQVKKRSPECPPWLINKNKRSQNIRL